MEPIVALKCKIIVILIFLRLFSFQVLLSQPVAGLDNWFNHETDSKTGKPYHYLWSDTSFSGYSKWGDIFIDHGIRITTVGKPYRNILKEINIYIIADPDTTSENNNPEYINDDDIENITEWVKNGGVLAILANDGPNCEFLHLNRLMSRFGMRFNHVTIHHVENDNFEEGAILNLPVHPLFTGVTKIFMKDISDISVSGIARPILLENKKVLMAECNYGKGYVFAVGDPWLYNEYIDHERLPDSFQNIKAAGNLTGLLISHIK